MLIFQFTSSDYHWFSKVLLEKFVTLLNEVNIKK